LRVIPPGWASKKNGQNLENEILILFAAEPTL